RLLSATGPRVIDFGIARALDATDGPTRTGQFVGTPNYLPPELLRGEQVTPASDVFSWGCVMAYAGTGRAPFAGNTVPEIFYRVAHDEPALDGLDPGLRDIIAAALDKDPARRPSVQELLGRLVGHSRPDPARIAETVESSWHTPATPPPPTYQAPVPPPQPPPPAGGVTRDDAPRPDGRGLPKPPHLSKKRLGIGGGAAGAAALVVVLLFAAFGSSGPPEKLATSFADDFSSTGSGWGGGSTFTGQYGYKDGKYRLETTSVDEMRDRWVPKEKATDIPERMLVTATVTVAQGADDSRFGLSCRANNDGETQYAFLIRKDGKGALLRKAAGAQGTKELANVDSVPGFDDKDPNKVQIACEPQDGNKEVRLRLWVNGEQVLDHTDDAQPVGHGWAGLIVERGGNAAQPIIADFDDFDLSQIRD
ncbi:protein kinase, partial [Spirillospora sp. NPDC029432]|uniref:protein kinase domain-containing protein n=1 Tax=Spirillospora sp. NPDC029432 TaxID=3154599 RepID=UPI003456566F